MHVTTAFIKNIQLELFKEVKKLGVAWSQVALTEMFHRFINYNNSRL